MIQSVIAGMVAAIRTEYDKSSYRIYTDSVEQGLKEPCFSIMCLKPSRERKLNRRYKDISSFMVQYFPKSYDEAQEECMTVCEALYDVLDVITVDGVRLQGTEMSGQVVDGVLQFQVNYIQMLMRTMAEDVKMDGVQVNAVGKE